MRFRINSMHCKSCYNNIQDALKEYDSSIKVEADFSGRFLSVDTQKSAEEVRKVIEEAGYPVDQVEKDH